MKRTKAGLWMAAALMASVARADAPKHWIKSGGAPQDYEVNVVPLGGPDGQAAAFVASKGASKGYGTLMQTVAAGPFIGRRVRFAANVKAERVRGWAGLWMRVDGPFGKVLAFDNMERRALRSTTEWTLCEVVLDVPAKAQEISFGLLVSGQGAASMSGLQIGTVGAAVPTTGRTFDDGVNPAPANLRFEE